MSNLHCITNTHQRSWFFPMLPSLLLVFMLAGCSFFQTEPLEVIPATTDTLPSVESTATSVPPAEAVSTPEPMTPVVSYTVLSTAPLTDTEASSPKQLRIPVVGLDADVVSMGWRVTEVNGVRTTVWVLPEAGVGWHPNSAPAGSVGNVVISGHQLLGDAPFASLALGDVSIGDDILLTDSSDRTFVYRVTSVSDPQPISTDTATELALAAQYTAQDFGANLTLVTGWPDFSSTHRLFVSAEFVGMTE